MTRLGFGENIKVFDQLAVFAADLKKQGGPLKGWEIPYWLSVFYDKTFNISERCYDEKYQTKRFTADNNPLRLVSMNTKEGLLESNGFRRRAWEHRTYRIYEATGLDLLEWLSMPTAHLEMILNDLRAEAAAVQLQQKQQQQELAKMTKDGPITNEQYEQQISKLTSGSKA